MTEQHNPCGIRGIEFVEFSSNQPESLRALFLDFGFARTLRHQKKKVDFYVQNDIHFLVNTEANSHAQTFCKMHGPCISSMGWRVDNAKEALAEAVKRGAKACTKPDYERAGSQVPAIYGIGDSLIYFIDRFSDKALYSELGFRPVEGADPQNDKGFLLIDHLTNNVEKGTMSKWSDFYKSVFGFTEIRYFDIRGTQTGLTSFALKSPDGSFCIPINEGTEAKSQINEYLREYNGPGIQHLAFLTKDILKSLDSLQGTKIQTLEMDEEYYKEVFERVPQVREDRAKIKKYNVLADGAEDGYLLQIFTKNVVGPIFIEIIQRENYLSFGEGNFGALFRSIERDQKRRGVL